MGLLDGWFRRKASVLLPGIVRPVTHTFVGSCCGHAVTLAEDSRGALTGMLTAFGKSRKTAVPRTGEGKVHYCLDCLSKMSIRCATCGDVIFVGDTISTGEVVGKPAFDNIVRDPKYPEYYIGCASNRACCPDIDYLAGHWMPNDDGTASVKRIR